jgi:hypothetical protein
VDRYCPNQTRRYHATSITCFLWSTEGIVVFAHDVNGTAGLPIQTYRGLRRFSEVADSTCCIDPNYKYFHRADATSPVFREETIDLSFPYTLEPSLLSTGSESLAKLAAATPLDSSSGFWESPVLIVPDDLWNPKSLILDKDKSTPFRTQHSYLLCRAEAQNPRKLSR